MSQALAFVPEAETSETDEYNDFTRRELAIALNSAKRGKVFLERFYENRKADPDYTKIHLLNKKMRSLIAEKQDVYTGDQTICDLVIEDARK